jgi:multidrug efflux system membrane fusion protein
MKTTATTCSAARRRALILAVLATAACGGSSKAPRTPPAVPVVTARVETRTVPVELRAIGHVEPISTVAVRPRVGGELTRVWFREGDVVPAGATLFTIDPRPYEAALRQAEAQLTRNRALLKKAEADLARYATLVERDYVTREEYDQINANADALRAGVAADQANVDTARLQLGYCTVAAPVAGRTGNLKVKVGNLVRANDDQPLVTINQIRPIQVAFSVPPRFLAAISARGRERIGLAAAVPGAAGPAAEGELSFVDNTVDEATATVLLKGTFANRDELLWPGQFVDVVMTLGEEPDRVVVPAAAVQTGQQGTYVFVVTAEGTAELRPVKVNRADEREAVIDDGVHAGETVVTDGQLRLVPGSRVEARGATP